MATKAPTASFTLSADDIISELSQLHPAPSSSMSSPASSSSTAPHPLLSLGRTLLPPSLQTDAGASPRSSLDAPSSEANLHLLHDALSRLDENQSPTSQASALLLSSIYLSSTRNILALNQEREEEEDPWSDAQIKTGATTGGLFDDLHRRVAKLQSYNEGHLARLQEVRDLVAACSSSSNGADNDAHTISTAR
jgi:hypothetical protein